MMRLLRVSFFSVASFFVAAPILAATAATPAGGRYNLVDPLSGITVPELVGNIIRIVLGLVGVLFLALFMYGGVMWMISGGEQKKVKAAQDTIKNAVLGLCAIVFSYTIVLFVVETVLGVAKK